MKKAWATVILVLITIVYSIIGAFSIRAIESAYETNTLTDVSQRLDRVINQFLAGSSCVNQTELHNVLTSVVKASEARVYITRNLTQSDWTSNWDVYLTFYFIVTTLTTIGYGNVSPESYGGRLFVVFYALIGIPLMLATLGAIGFWLSRVFDRCCFRPCKFDENGEEVQDRSSWSTRKHVARFVLNFLVFLIFFAFLPAAAFIQFEDWTFGEGVYYALITLTTVGFGDLEAGSKSMGEYQKRNTLVGLYRLGVAAWIIFGLVSCASVITCIGETYSAVARRIREKASELADAVTEEMKNADVRSSKRCQVSPTAIQPPTDIEPADNTDTTECSDISSEQADNVRI